MAGALVSDEYRFMGEMVADLLQLNDKLKAITDIEGKMEKLKELSTIIDKVIQDLDSRPFIDDAVKDLLKKLKYLAYDIEDVVDFYDTGVLRKQRSKTSFKTVSDLSSSNNQVVFTSSINDMIQAATNSLDSILLQKSILLNLPQGSICMSEPSLYIETHSRNSFDVIGREPEKNMIVDMLTNDDDDESSQSTLKVIAIVGMGGLGKTTLAQLAYNDARVQDHFANLTMWKVVGAKFNPTKILKSVLELATRKSVNISEIDLVRQELEKELSGKRFLLVLDDVWNEDPFEWGVLKAALTCGARGSRILVTTRSQQVSSIMGSSSTTHQIQQLSKDDCLSLFKQFAFGDQAVDQSLMEIGGMIVEKCGGVPLAAISLGSMLRGSRDETYWSSVLNNEIWQLPDEEQKVLAVLKLSYDTLPPQSKKCFAFGSLFPKDYTMQKDELIKLWIANGFVRSEGNFDAETVANRVFADLVGRSFFLLAPSYDFEDDRRVTECTMHDLMHDLTRSVSGNVYWNSKEDSVEDIKNRTYHLHLYSAHVSEITQALGKKPLYLHTLILSHCDLSLKADLLEIDFSKLKFLRVLDLSGNEIKKVPTSIENLIHLRYLNLSGNNIEFLPESITLLRNLQFLYCDYLGLQHMPYGLSRLTKLRRLPLFVADNRSDTCSIIELEDLKLHGEMTIKFSENFTNYSCSGRKVLKNKHLNELCLRFNGSLRYDKEMLDDLCPNKSIKKLTICNYGSRQFPEWLMESQLPNLVEVCLESCGGCKHIPPFGNLRFLKKLDLQFIIGITHMGAEFHGRGGFPSLQELILNRMYNLEEWSESHVVGQLFPSLQKLWISNCPELKCMPKLPRIQELNISNCNRSLLSCARRLTSLSVLKVENMDDMTSFPSGGIRNLTYQVVLVSDASRFMGEKVADPLQLKAITDNEGKMEKLKDLSTIHTKQLLHPSSSGAMEEDLIEKVADPLQLKAIIDNEGKMEKLKDLSTIHTKQLLHPSSSGAMEEDLVEKVADPLQLKAITDNEGKMENLKDFSTIHTKQLLHPSSGAMEEDLVEKVEDLLQLDQKLKAMTGIKRKMKKLKELSTIIDKVIQDIESRPFIDDAVKDLLKKLKYLAYDLEDVVDYYDTKVLQKKQRSESTSLRPVRDFFSSDHNQVAFKGRMNGMIQAVTDSLDFILLQKSILHSSLPQDSIPMSELSLRVSKISLNRETHSINSWEVKGRDTEKQTIIEMLTEDDDDESNHDTVKVIAIVGMGGLGKTTLAQLVYNDQSVQGYFASLPMWKVVGAEFDPKKIMKSILELATRKSVNISEIDLVRQELEKKLSGTRFLLVLDDVWNEDQAKWGILKAALTCGARGSKILVTTRSQRVSKIMGSFKTHQIQQLFRDDCLSLFQQFAFGNETVDQKLMKIGEKIVEKCGGVPLAVISLGGMLRGRDEAYWSWVLKREICQLRNNEEEKLFAILKLSYNALHPQSKKCLAFASLFPKYYMMRKDELIKLWIANGFTSSERNVEAETVGNNIFDDLVWRSFILLAPVQYDPDVTKCMMHDLMHDLVRSVSADAYWNSYQDSVENIGNRTYHLQIVEGKLPDMTRVFDKKPLYLRTFMSLMTRYSFSLSINLLEVFSKLKYLRALDLTDCGIREIPKSIENLIHLRYLNLYYNRIEVLPNSITHLPNLQYLNLGFNPELQQLPKELGNMQNLRELDLEMDYELTHIPCGLSRLTNLRSLPVFIAGDKTGACSITELENLKLRGGMQIKFSNDFKNYSSSGRKILKNTDLNELHIEFNGSSERYDKDMLDDLCPNTSLKKLEISNYRSPEFPTWLKLIEIQLPNLVEVRLHCARGHNIPPFGNLQSLKMLTFSMHGITHLGAEFHGSGGFPSLKKLSLSRMDDLEEWSESHDDDELFPSLRWLHIMKCPNLKSTPRLPTLRHLEIEDCSESILPCIGRLTSLSVLRLLDINDMTSLPNDCIRNLTSLTELEIILCRQLQSLPGDEMQYLQKLRSLTIEGCYNLVSLPDWLQHLKSLRLLVIHNCPRLETVPRGLMNLHMLETLIIVGCPQLESRCERDTGEDWPIISHVRNVYIRSVKR